MAAKGCRVGEKKKAFQEQFWLSDGSISSYVALIKEPDFGPKKVVR